MNLNTANSNSLSSAASHHAACHGVYSARLSRVAEFVPARTIVDRRWLGRLGLEFCFSTRGRACLRSGKARLELRAVLAEVLYACMLSDLVVMYIAATIQVSHTHRSACG